MKRLKRIMALVIAMAMVVAMALPSFAAETEKVKVIYDANGGNGTNIPATAEVVKGQNYTLVVSPVPGHDKVSGRSVVFAGWTDNNQILNVQEADADVTLATTINSIAANHTVYAVWGFDDDGNGKADFLDTKYTISYNANGGNGAPAAETALAGSSPALSAVEPTYAGNIFLGWSTDSAITGKVYKAGDTAPEAATAINNIAENTTVYAIWGEDSNNDGIADCKQEKKTITYNANGGVTAPEAYTDYVGTSVTLPTGLTKEGYTFLGWTDTNNTSVSGNYDSTADLPNVVKSYTIPNADTTLYAVFGKSDNNVGTYVIEVKNSNDNIAMDGKEYKAFKLFDLTYADTNGDNVNDAYAYTISTSNQFYTNAVAKAVLDEYFTFADTADSTVKSVVAKQELSEADIRDIADRLQDFLSTATADASATAAGNAAYIYPEVAGYYLVSGNVKSTDGATADIASAIAITNAEPTGTINVKADAPHLDKTITSDNLIDNDENTASIGDTVNFKIETTVPDLTGFDENYFYIVHDTLSAGLTLVDTNNAGFTVKIGSDTLARDTDADGNGKYDTNNTGYYVTTEGTTNIKIVFKDFLQYKGDYDENSHTFLGSHEGQKITIEYAAKVNDEAVIGNDGNTNTAKLQYSNNPNAEGTGKPNTPDEPQDDDVTGVTPDDTTKTYVTGIELEKIDGQDSSKKLQGVVFTIKGEKLNDIKETTYERFVEVASGGTYYLLTDGTYTETAPNDQTADKYVEGISATAKYKKETGKAFSKAAADKVEYTATTDANGRISFTGLNAGTYTITEIKTNDGYNLLSSPIEIVIGTRQEDDHFAAFTFSKDGEAPSETVNANKLYEFQVENNTGTQLPSTGGIGTTIFYVVGAILVIGAGVVLITRRRMDA